MSKVSPGAPDEQYPRPTNAYPWTDPLVAAAAKAVAWAQVWKDRDSLADVPIYLIRETGDCAIEAIDRLQDAFRARRSALVAEIGEFDAEVERVAAELGEGDDR